MLHSAWIAWSDVSHGSNIYKGVTDIAEKLGGGYDGDGGEVGVIVHQHEDLEVFEVFENGEYEVDMLRDVEFCDGCRGLHERSDVFYGELRKSGMLPAIAAVEIPGLYTH